MLPETSLVVFASYLDFSPTCPKTAETLRLSSELASLSASSDTFEVSPTRTLLRSTARLASQTRACLHVSQRQRKRRVQYNGTVVYTKDWRGFTWAHCSADGSRRLRRRKRGVISSSSTKCTDSFLAFVRPRTPSPGGRRSAPTPSPSRSFEPHLSSGIRGKHAGSLPPAWYCAVCVTGRGSVYLV